MGSADKRKGKVSRGTIKGDRILEEARGVGRIDIQLGRQYWSE